MLRASWGILGKSHNISKPVFSIVNENNSNIDLVGFGEVESHM